MSTQATQRVGEIWQKRAACKGPQSVVFFPPSHAERKDERESREKRAKAICAVCPVRRACLEYALRIREPHGIWGGLNELERKQLASPGEGDHPSSSPRRRPPSAIGSSHRGASGAIVAGASPS